jgi:DNA-binding NarL/FixJ family response regulator
VVAILNKIPDVQIVGEAGDGREALALVQVHAPDVVVLDIAMPELNGVEVAARLSRDYPQVRVIMLSMYTSEKHVLRALQAGAGAYLVKEGVTLELEQALQAVVKGQTYLSPGVSKQVVLAYLRRVGSTEGSLELLTPRQREILQLIAESHGTKEIAKKLAISVKTVENTRLQLMDRLDIHDIAGLVRYAIEVDLVQLKS